MCRVTSFSNCCGAVPVDRREPKPVNANKAIPMQSTKPACLSLRMVHPFQPQRWTPTGTQSGTHGFPTPGLWDKSHVSYRNENPRKYIKRIRKITLKSPTGRRRVFTNATRCSETNTRYCIRPRGGAVLLDLR